MGDERAETYLGRLAEAELRRAGDQLRRLDAAAGDAWADPGMAPFAIAGGAGWKVGRAGMILVAAGVLDQDFLRDLGGDLGAAINVRSRLLLNWDRRRGMLHRTIFGPPVPRPPRGARHPLRVTPVGRALRGASDQAPWTLHLMSLTRTETEAVITAALRLHRPPDGLSADQPAGPHHLPYDQLGAVDDQGTRYPVRFESGRYERTIWKGFARLSPVPPPAARWLDLTGDGTPLIRLPLGAPAPPGRQPAPPATERVALEPSERLLVLEAEHILTTGDATGGARGQIGGPRPGEIVTVLMETGAIAAGSPVPGQLAALCQRLGAAGHGITVPPGEELPAPWASVIAHRDAPVPAGVPEEFAPLARVLPDVDGACFALAGWSTAAGESHLYVISSSMPPLAGRFAWNWAPGYSWWLRDSAGNWHVGSPGEPDTYGDGMSLYSFGDGMQAFWLRLTPPLTAPLGAAELVVTGPATQVRVLVSERGTGRPPAE